MKKARILYVEDEVFLAKIVKESMESRGYEVHLVTEGDKALRAFKDFKPHLSVLDVMLPRMSGFDIGKQIRAQAERHPILYLTAKDQTEDVIEGFKSGANDYIRKPCSLEELMLRIENLLQLVGEQLEEAPEQYRIGDFSFDAREYLLHFPDGKQEKLSHKEAQILLLLLENRNEKIEREEILNAVWGEDSFYHSRRLDVYIAKLRGYFKARADIKIMTLRGVGYRFLVP